MRSRWLLLPVLLLLCSANLRADSVTLTSGETVTGTIKSETASDITIEVPVSSTITDERVIQKQDIVKIDKEQPDQVAYQQLIQIRPSTQLSYSSQAYDQILSALNGFQAKYPNSVYLPDIKKLATTFQDEKARVDAGQVKYLGQWLSKDEAAGRAVQINALELYDSMQRQAASGDLVGAMETFDSIAKDYSGSRSYPAAVVLAEQVLVRLQQDLVVRMQQVKADQDQLKKTIDFTAEPDKSALIASAKAEQDHMNETIEMAIKSGAKWVPLIPRSQASVETLQKTANAESSGLPSIPVAAMNTSIEKVDEARTAMAAGDFKTANTLLEAATQLWSGNEDAQYLSARLKERMATPTPAPSVAPTPTPHPTPHLALVAAPVAAVATTPLPAPPPQEEKPFYMTIQGAITIAAIVLIVGGAAASYSQKKARQQHAAE